jgi:hypothetical protein
VLAGHVRLPADVLEAKRTRQQIFWAKPTAVSGMSVRQLTAGAEAG